MTLTCRGEGKLYPDPQPSGSEINPETMSEARRVYGATDTSQAAEEASTSEEKTGSATSDTSSSSETTQPGDFHSLAAPEALPNHQSTPVAVGIPAKGATRPIMLRNNIGHSLQLETHACKDLSALLAVLVGRAQTSGKSCDRGGDALNICIPGA